MNIYAPIPDYDQSVEYVTQADPVTQDDGSIFYDVVINPIDLGDQDLTNPQTFGSFGGWVRECFQFRKRCQPRRY